jgi:Ca2+-binding RTX toxin-like protein
LQFSKAVFAAISGSVGALSADQFWSGAGAIAGHDADDRIIYNTTTGALYYDADGSGAGVAVQVALIGAVTHPAVAYSDIQLIA